jgi:hypothetical protein
MKIPIEGAGTTGAIERWILDILILIVLKLCKGKVQMCRGSDFLPRNLIGPGLVHLRSR